MNEYATLTQLRAYLGLGTTETTDDAILQTFLERAARLFDSQTGRVFYPRIATRYYDYPADNPSELYLKDDLLAATTVTTANADTTLSATDYYLMCGDNYNRTPYNRLVCRPDQTNATLSYSDSVLKSQAVTGEWGYREEYSNRGWELSGDTLKTTVTAAATSIPVNDADGADLWGITPRFQAGQIIKIDSEFMYITAVTAATTNTLTVIRAWNGSTAAAHTGAVTTYIYIWRPQPEVVQALLRWAGYLYRQKDASHQDGKVAYPALNMVVTPINIPADVMDVIRSYRRLDL